MINFITRSILEAMQLTLNDNILYLAALTIFFIIASYTDIKHMKIYNKFNWAMLFTRILMFAIFYKYQTPHLTQYIAGGGVMFISFLIVGMYGTTKMGGDIKFAGNLGLWIGFKASILLTIVLILVNLLFRLIANKKGRVALAPFFFIAYIILALIAYLL